MTKRRSSTSPVWLETVLYLKYNKDLWSLQEVVQANKERQKSNREGRAAEMAAEDAEHEAVVNDGGNN